MTYKSRFAIVTLIVTTISVLLVSYIHYGSNSLIAPFTKENKSNLNTILSQYQEQILLLLLGRDSCPGTAKAMSILDGYATEKPDGVVIVRVDVPLPGESLQPSSGVDYAFRRFMDNDRLVASELDFFYYPTLYVFDGDGTKRFVGGCDKDLVAQMVQEILAEQPGHTKKIYTLPMPEIGTQAPSFSGSTPANETVALNTLLGESGLLIFFSKASCSFSTKELPHLKDITDAVCGKGVSTVIVSQKETTASDSSIYEMHCAGVPVVQDRTGDIFKSFGVDATPFFYLLDKNAMIIKHRSFTHTVAMNSVNAMLGLEPEKHRFESTKAG